MHDFKYQNGRFYCEKVAIEPLVKQHGTPLYLYSQGTLTRNFERLRSAMAALDPLICYAVKANANASVLRTFANLGGGFDPGYSIRLESNPAVE